MNPVDDLELAAHMTESEAVQRSFDARNATMLAIYSVIFAVVDVPTFVYGLAMKRAPHLTWLVAAVEALISLVAARVFIDLARSARNRPRQRAAEYVARNQSDWIIAYMLVQFAGFCYMGSLHGSVIWGTLMPFLVIGLRFSAIRRFAVHAALFAITAALLFFFGSADSKQNLAAVVANNTISLGLGWLNSRRVRKTVVSTWSERRVSAREQLRMRDELRYARELQLSMLPESAPVVSWADIAGVSIPATEVGGDYFDYLDVDGSLAVVSGDVAGHGLASGITLSALRGAITLLRHDLADPANVLQRLHEVITEISRRRTLVTFAAVLFDPVRRVAKIANAGHPPVFVRRASGRIDSIDLFGPPLGVRRNEPIAQREVPFESGDVFVVHSDGIYEATNPAGEQYGLERLADVLRDANGTATEIRDAVLRSVEQFRSTAPQNDDLTLVVVKITAAPERTSDRS